MFSFDKFLKRFFDLNLSLVGLILSSPLIIISWIISSIETSSNGFFFQQRVGKDSRLFSMVKIKTMISIANINETVTTSNDARITISGAFFRRTKIDELPQLWNIFIGQMSFVGPRPDVPGYADKLQGDDRIILTIKPGITGPAQLAYKNEEAELAEKNDPVKYNDEVIWPDKVKINKEYVKNKSFFKDIGYIYKTVIGNDDKH